MNAKQSKRQRLSTDDEDVAQSPSPQSDDVGTSKELSDDEDSTIKLRSRKIVKPKKTLKRKQGPLIPPYMQQEIFNELSADPKEKLLIWNALRHVLNPDCLSEIFDRLPVHQLVTLCEMSEYFEEIIVDRVIGKKLIDFTKMEQCWTTDKFFRVFGKRMRKFRIGGESTLHSFEHFLKFIINHCEEGQLNDLHLRFRDPSCPLNVIEESMKFFTNLTGLTINDPFLDPRSSTFMHELSKTATNFRALDFRGCSLSGDWSRITEMHKLTELKLRSRKHNDSPDLSGVRGFLENKSMLKGFFYSGYTNIESIFETLATQCINLEAFVDVYLNNPHKYNSRGRIIQEIERRYGVLSQMNNLRKLGVTSFTRCCSDLHYVMIRIPKTLEKLTVYLNVGDAIHLPDDYRYEQFLNHFQLSQRIKNVKEIEINITNDSSDVTQHDLGCEYIVGVIGKFKNIKKVLVEGDCIKDVYKLLEIAPHIEYFNISQVGMKYLPVEMLRIVRTIRKNQQGCPSTSNDSSKRTIHLVVNQKQWNEIQVYSDINSLVTTDISEDEPGFKFRGKYY